ncbi:ATP-binding protein [Micromonospora sp. NPDC048930]|uniref:ATP-binding protein n=1 Tax=Micromonospora sp. NPDC048930 TaxID=3364261 RepID=UPI003710D7C1
MSIATVEAPARGTPSALADPRLLAWRHLFVSGAAEVLRRYREAWADPTLDDATRAVAAVGVVDPHPRVALLPLPAEGEFAELVRVTGLDTGAEAVLAIAWWAAVEPQVAIVCGCVHDDAGRRWPSLGLLAHVLAGVGVTVPLTVDATHPLVRGGLLDALLDPDAPVRLPTTSVAAIAGQRPAPAVPGGIAPRVAAAAARIAALLDAGVPVLARCEVADDRTPLRDAVAAQLGIAPAPAVRPPAVARLLLRLGHELPAVLLEPGAAPPDGTVFALGGTDEPGPPGWHVVELAAPTLAVAEQVWRRALRQAGVAATPDELADLVGRLPLAEPAIAAVVGRARAVAALDGRAATARDVSAALRAQPRHDPGGFARRLPATTTLDDLVLPPATLAAVRDLVAHARHSPAAHDRLGFIGRRGRAVIALFHGPSGTGKTAAAEAVAAAIDRDLWIVDLARVVTKWLGETQRNLDTVLRDAATAGAVLLFDEADGLFGKRGEVTDARDRYANLEIDHLLQRIEVHTGVVVLTSNRPAALDDAFARRIRLAVRFDLPDHGERELLWRRHLPDVDTAVVAREELSGATIRAAALAATVSAIAAGTEVRSEHLHAAVRRELEKSRRPPTARRHR